MNESVRAPRLRPIASIGDLLAWEPGARPEDLYRSSVPLREDLPRSDPSSPRVLACHDFKGGYGVDALACGVFESAKSSSSASESSASSPPLSSSESLSSSSPRRQQRPSPYRFTHWRSIDAFVYFAHDLVTVPPPCWVEAAHGNGVLCLGTLIFEHEAGERAASEAFRSSDAAESVARKLAEVARWFGFDGWLFNVEVDFAKTVGGGEGEERDKRVSALVDNCLLCLRRARELLRSSSPSSLVLWYDAVCDRGRLRWQNGLTRRNARFFAEADGIFTNYCWSEKHLKESAELAETSKRSRCEVWAGADAFGRGSFGGEGTRGVSAAARAAASARTSLAVFAPAWVFEAFEDSCPSWRARGDELWRGVDEAYGPRRKRKGEGLPSPFYSPFCAGGAGRGWWTPSGDDDGDGFSSSSLVGGPWFHLSLADAPAPARQRWGAASVALLPEEGGTVRLSLVVAEAAVVRAGAGERDAEVFSPDERGRGGLGASSAFDGGGALAVAAFAFGPALSPRSGRTVEFVLFGDEGGGEESENEDDEGNENDDDDSLTVRAWTAERGGLAGAPPVSLSLVVGGRRRGRRNGVGAVLPLPPSSSPSSSSSSSCRWKRHELRFSRREKLGGSSPVASLSLRLEISGGEGGSEDGRGDEPRVVSSATVGAVSVSPSSFDARLSSSPVATGVSVRRGGVGGGCDVEWGSASADETGNVIGRWEVFLKKKDDDGPCSLSFLGASRARRWWIESESDDRGRAFEPGDEVVVRAVFADGSREGVDRAGRGGEV